MEQQELRNELGAAVAAGAGDVMRRTMMAVDQGREGERIVVGVDGSDSSKTALAWAVRQAALTGAEVDAVNAWQIPATYGYGYAMPIAVPDLEKIAGQILDEAIAEAAKLAPDVQIRPVIAQDNPARALLNTAKGADLLVVGSRGHAGFAEALLGSVGQHCVHHAECPVVVIRGPRGGGA
jgi:nucleotide-binding universal stress UspA family protein